MTKEPLPTKEKRPISNLAQIVSAISSMIALIVGGYSLWIAYSNYKDTQDAAMENKIRDTYTKLYDKDVEIWKTVVSYPVIHTLIFEDSNGHAYSEQDGDTKSRAACVFQTLADLFEYYFLIKDELTSSKWDNRKDCWSDYFKYTVVKSFGFRKYIRTYEKEWTTEFKEQFNSVLDSEKMPSEEYRLTIESLVVNPLTDDKNIEQNSPASTEIHSSTATKPEWINSLNRFAIETFRYLYSFPVGVLIGWLLSLYTTKLRIDAQRKIETAKILTEINKASITNKILPLFWDKYRTKQVYQWIKDNPGNKTNSEGTSRDSGSPQKTAIRVFPGTSSAGYHLDAADYFSIRNFAYFKLNLFELTHDSGIDGMKSGSWRGYLLYSIKNSSFMREIATDHDKEEFYSPSFCSLLKACLERSFVECISKNLNRKNTPLPAEWVNRLQMTNAAKNLTEWYSEFETSTRSESERKRVEDICNGYIQAFDALKATRFGIFSRSTESTESILEKSIELKNLLEIFHQICSVKNRWDRHELLDSLYLSVLDREEFTVSPMHVQQVIATNSQSET